MAEIINSVICPIKNKEIDICECIDIQFVADNSATENLIDFKLSDEDKRTCLNCKKRIDPAL